MKVKLTFLCRGHNPTSFSCHIFPTVIYVVNIYFDSTAKIFLPGCKQEAMSLTLQLICYCCQGLFIPIWFTWMWCSLVFWVWSPSANVFINSPAYWLYIWGDKTSCSTDLLNLSRLCQRWDLKFLIFWASSRIKYRQDLRRNAWWSCSTNLYDVMHTWKALGLVQPYE